jgi:hypothetical protein
MNLRAWLAGVLVSQVARPASRYPGREAPARSHANPAERLPSAWPSRLTATVPRASRRRWPRRTLGSSLQVLSQSTDTAEQGPELASAGPEPSPSTLAAAHASPEGDARVARPSAGTARRPVLAPTPEAATRHGWSRGRSPRRRPNCPWPRIAPGLDASAVPPPARQGQTSRGAGSPRTRRPGAGRAAAGRAEDARAGMITPPGEAVARVQGPRPHAEIGGKGGRGPRAADAGRCRGPALWVTGNAPEKA